MSTVAEEMRESLERLQSQSGGQIADGTVGTFCTVREYSDALSAAAGEPVYIEVTYCDVRVPGNAKANHRQIIRKIMPDGTEIMVSEAKIKKYPRAWDAFLRGEDLKPEGLPLEECPDIPKAAIMRLRAADVQTVEELAALPDRSLQRIGLDGRALQRAAQDYVSEHGQAKRMQEDLEQLKAELAELKAERAKDGDTEKPGPKRRGRPRRKDPGDGDREHGADSPAAT